MVYQSYANNENFIVYSLGNSGGKFVGLIIVGDTGCGGITGAESSDTGFMVGIEDVKGITGAFG